MPQTVLLNKKGLTLIEVMVALVVLLLVFLALMQTALVSIDSNMINVLRDEAVNIAEEQMSNQRNLSTPFSLTLLFQCLLLLYSEISETYRIFLTPLQ